MHAVSRVALLFTRLRGAFREEPGVSASDTFAPAGGVAAMKQGDRTVLLDADQGEYFGMGSVGGRIWELLSGGASVAEVVDRLHAEFQVDRAELERDVLAFVAELRASRLIRS